MGNGIDFQPIGSADNKIDFKSDTAPDPTKEIIGHMGTLEKFLVGTGYGLEKARIGAMQLGAELLNKAGIASDESVNKLRKEHEENMRVMAPLKEESTAANIGEFVGEAAPYLAIPGGVEGGMAAKLGTGAAIGAVQGAAQPLTTDDSRLASTAVGATVGTAAPIVTAPIVKAVNAVKTPLLDELSQLSKKYGVRASLGEITNNPHWKKAETWLEQIPILGIKGFRQKQFMEADRAAKNSLLSYIIDPNAPDIKEANTAFVNNIYNQFKQFTAGQNITTEAPMTHVKASELLDRYSPIFESLQDNKVKSILQNISKDTTATTKNPVVEVSVDDLWQAREGLWKAMDRAWTSKNKEAYGVFSEMRDAITDDLNTLAEKIHPGASDTFKQANDAFKHYEKKYEILQDAYEKATSSKSKEFSPQLFSRNLDRIVAKQKDRYLFSKDELDELKGVSTLMNKIQRAGQFQENPPTGNRWGLPIMAEMAGWKKTAMTVPYVAVAKFLTTTEVGKRFAMAASKVSPDSPAMANMLKIIHRYVVQGALLGTQQTGNYGMGGQTLQ